MKGEFWRRGHQGEWTPDSISAQALYPAGNDDTSGSSVNLLEKYDYPYLNNVVEQDHRAINRRTRPMMGFKSFWSATKIITGIETMHMIYKGQLGRPGDLAFSPADYFYSLAAD